MIFEYYAKGDEVNMTVKGGSWRTVGVMNDIGC